MIYATDLDGTLLDNNAELSQYSREIIKKFIQTNKMTFLTARSYSVCKKKLGDIPFNIPCAVLNGSYIIDYRTGEVLEEHLLDSNLTFEIINRVMEKGVLPIIICNIGGDERMLYGDYNNKGYKDFIKQRNGDKRLLHIDLDKIDMYRSRADFITIQLIDKENKIREIKKVLNNYDIKIYIDRELYCPGYYYMNINPKSATKATALQNIARLCDSEACDFIVFGDQSNDIEMLDIAGKAYAVENAIEELKKKATGIIGGNNNDGVARFLEKQLNNKLKLRTWNI